jgi:transcriptional regulator with XRE-family HTH domain
MQERREELGTLARRRRLTLGFDQEDVARRAGLRSRTTVINFEAGRSVKQRTLWKLDDGYGWRRGSSELFLETGQPPEVVDQPEADPNEDIIRSLPYLSTQRKARLLADYRKEKARNEALEEQAQDPKRRCG